MTGNLLGGGYKPLTQINIKMELSKAMAILEFPPSQAFEHTELIEVERRFMIKIHQIAVEEHCGKNVEEQSTKSYSRFKSKKDKNTVFFKQKSDARKLNEAFQFLVQRRRRLTGRAMHTNWKLLASKTTAASNVTNAFQLTSGAEIPATMDNAFQKKSPGGPESDFLKSLLGLSKKMKDTSINSAENETNTGEVGTMAKSQQKREQDSKEARELANELISAKRIKSLQQVLDESRTIMEMNYWLQFSLMSKENRDYFTKRHGRNPDQFLARLRRTKKENNRMSVKLPARLQHHKEEKSKTKKEYKNRNGDPRIPQRNKSGSFKMPSTNKKSNRNEIDYLNIDYAIVSNNEIDECKSISGPLLAKEKCELAPGEGTEGEEYECVEDAKLYIQDEYSNTNSNDGNIDMTEEVLDDTPAQQNSTETPIKKKLAVLRRKLSHLNMNPNLPQ